MTTSPNPSEITLKTEITRLREALGLAEKALEPFETMGAAFCKADDYDNSPWAMAPDQLELQIGVTPQPGWTISVMNLRSVVAALDKIRSV